MGSMVNFSGGAGYLAGDSGPGILVIQEWWGLVPQIKGVCDRYADAGFVALAPDFYGGQTTTEPDEASKLMMEMQVPAALATAGAALKELASRASTTNLGVTGYCIGGGLALLVAAANPESVAAVAPYYGLVPWPGANPDWAQMRAEVQGHFAELDEYFSPDFAGQLERSLHDAGRKAEIFVYPGAHHAFANETRPEVFDPAATATAWDRTTTFFRSRLSD